MKSESPSLSILNMCTGCVEQRPDHFSRSSALTSTNRKKHNSYRELRRLLKRPLPNLILFYDGIIQTMILPTYFELMLYMIFSEFEIKLQKLKPTKCRRIDKYTISTLNSDLLDFYEWKSSPFKACGVERCVNVIMMSRKTPSDEWAKHTTYSMQTKPSQAKTRQRRNKSISDKISIAYNALDSSE